MILDDLKASLSYDADTGAFTWLPRVVGKSRGTPWAGRRAGSIWSANKNVSYVVISFMGKKYFAHRLAFLITTGRWPEPCVDHIDGNGLNNAWTNLREASKSLNRLNTHRRGLPGRTIGVRFDERRQQFSAKLYRNGHSRWLGYFQTEAAAAQAYDAALAAYQGQAAGGKAGLAGYGADAIGRMHQKADAIQGGDQ